MERSKSKTHGRIGFIGVRLWLFVLVLLALIVPPQHTQAAGGISRIWAVDDGEKVKKTDNNHPLATSSDNPVWNGSDISLFGARNEVIAFQLIIEADTSGINNVDVSLDNLSSGSYVIKNTGSSNPFDYIGKRIELFTEHYLNIEHRTVTGFHWWSRARPMDVHGDEYLGWIPDALIPFEAPTGLGGAPFDIAPNCNQGVWIDIYIPRDAPADVYTGTLKVSVNSRLTHNIPVSLRVYNFTLADEMHLKNFFILSSTGIIKKYGIRSGTSQYYEVEGRYHQMAHRHRMDLTLNVNLDKMKNHYKRYITGTYYTKSNKYEGPGQGVGHGTYSIGTYDQPSGKVSGFSPATEAQWRKASDAWVTWFEENAPDVEIFKYMRDEPMHDPKRYFPSIKRKCEWIHNNPGPGRRLMTFCTVKIHPDLEGYIDFWSATGQCGYVPPDGVPSGYIVEKAREQQKKGKKVGFYNGTRPSFGVAMIDTDAVDLRVNPWIAWKYNADQYFYWLVNYHGGRLINKFKDHNIASGGRRSNGDGSLFYPGADKEFPEEDRGLRGPISSIRVKNWRRGMQDYEYLWLAVQAGFGSKIQGIVNRVVPAAFNEIDRAGLDALQPWAMRGYTFEQQRKKLSDLISSGATGTVSGKKPQAVIEGYALRKQRMIDY